MGLFLIAALILSQNYTPIQAAPSVEACPPDSTFVEDQCLCNPESCIEPPCLSLLNVATNATDEPGSCCPIYDCVDCDNDTLIEGKCPCAPGAVLNNNQCQCVDEEKHLVNGECVCNPLQCPIPPLCDRKSVPLIIDDGCCKKTICKSCPSDSESTHLETDELDDHCVCLPCKKECSTNRIAVVKKHGSGLPGHCCDLYECKLLDEIGGCNVGGTVYQNGEEWLSIDEQKCICQNGLSLCSKIPEEKSLSCVEDHKIYKHNESWIQEDGCTYCKCMNGEEKCISHYCEVKESQIKNNETQPCFSDNKEYQHLETWIEKDGCTRCTCLNGKQECILDFCETEPVHKTNECQPMANCNKTCIRGFKINKKGCEICKCNSFKVIPDVLNKYNITMKDLLSILDDYKNQQTSTSTTTTTTPTSPPLIEVSSTISSDVIDRNAKIIQEDPISSTTTEPSIVPANGTGYWTIVIAAVVILTFACVVSIIAYICKSKKKCFDKYTIVAEKVNKDNNNTVHDQFILKNSNCDNM